MFNNIDFKEIAKKTKFLNDYELLLLKTIDKDEKIDTSIRVIPTTGTNNCGGRCVIKAHVKDDMILRLSTDEAEDSFEKPQLRSCVRGRAYRKTYFSKDRLKYPMKRVGKRGEGKFQRISWEEAVDIIASETKRIKKEYGAESRYVNYAHGYNARIQAQNLAKRLLSLDGGFLDFYNSYSSAATKFATPFTYGTENTGNSPDDWINSKLIILWGHNPAETIFGTSMYYLRKAKDKGAKIIVIDPRCNDTAIGLGDEWIPILPGTDAALMDAMAYVMVEEDLYDKDFVNSYSIGFDSENIQEGIGGKESYKSYLLGEVDGILKTPEWAEKICKLSKDRIRSLAREYATTKPAALIQGWGPQRTSYGEQTVRGGTVLATMTGNVGISGGWASGYGGYSRQKIDELPKGENPYKGKIPVFTWTDAVVRGNEMTAKDGVRGVEKLNTNIKLIYNLAGNSLINQHADCNRTSEILKDESKVEFIVVSDIFMTASAKYADILLPGDSFFERDNIATPWSVGDFVIYANKVVEPMFQCRSEYSWLIEVAEKLGIRDKFTEGHETMEDWCRWIVEGVQSRYVEFPSYEKFKEDGIYKWVYEKPHIAFEENIKDIDKNPFQTDSGRIEIFSKRLYDMNEPEEIPAIPKYIKSWEGPEDSLKERYPIQCIGHHTKRRCHSIHDNNSWMEELEGQRIWINKNDASLRGIEDGDLVKVYNSRGSLLVRAKVTDKIIEGAASLPQGAWWTPNKDGVDTRGCINSLTTHRTTPLAKANPQHTNLVEIIKAVGENNEK